MSPPSVSRRRAGFTLIELVVVLVVFGIMAGLAAPRMGGMLNFNRLERAANQLTADISYARMVAVRSAQRVRVELRETEYRVLRGGEQLKRVNLAREHPGLALSVTPAPPGMPAPIVGILEFDSRGLLVEGVERTVLLERQGRSTPIQVLLTGKVYRASQ